MDTRRKILSLEAARSLPHPVTLVTGTFDVLRAAHARELETIRDRTVGSILAVVLPGENALMPQRARAELVAALRVIDYVVAAGARELEDLIDALHPAEIVRMEAADAQRTKHLIEHVHRRQVL